MDFVRSHFGAPATVNPPKRDDKYAQKSVQLVRVSKVTSYKIHTLLSFLKMNKFHPILEDNRIPTIKHTLGGLT